MSDYIDELTDLFEAFSRFTETMKNAARKDMLQRHPFYNELVEELEEKKKVVDKLLNELSEEHKEVISDYIVDLKDMHHFEGDYFYMRGYTDCIRLFHRFNL